MELDPNYVPPPGFEPVFNSPDGHRRIPIVGEIRLDQLKFYIGHPPTIIPALPLKGTGELWSIGWSIPTSWAIDAVGECWMNGAHGGSLHRTPASSLLAAAEEYEDRQKIRVLLGMNREKPEWQSWAEAAGWKPPLTP